MKRIAWSSASRRPSTGARLDADEALYEAALAALLAQPVQPPGVLGRLRGTVWSALKGLHARRRQDGDRLPPEHWFLHC